MSNPTDTNQASEDVFERRVMDCLLIARSFKGEGRRDMHELLPIHADLLSIIRTEKLKLLAEVRERVVGENTSYQSATTEELVSPFHLYQGKNALRSEQLELLDKLEAEL